MRPESCCVVVGRSPPQIGSHTMLVCVCVFTGRRVAVGLASGVVPSRVPCASSESFVLGDAGRICIRRKAFFEGAIATSLDGSGEPPSALN